MIDGTAATRSTTNVSDRETIFGKKCVIASAKPIEIGTAIESAKTEIKIEPQSIANIPSWGGSIEP
jgi:hypothetical protein